MQNQKHDKTISETILQYFSPDADLATKHPKGIMKEIAQIKTLKARLNVDKQLRDTVWPPGWEINQS